MSEDTGAVSKKRAGPENPLKSLIARLEEERHALTRQLRGRKEKFSLSVALGKQGLMHVRRVSSQISL
ncbi:hypothetical protein DPMN_016290 [Dreissena polymorpha]|uniref:Uncharacterized protein n=1 Tax=Dreissena polymorpha TaxID=45954 RepID=A0A9D4NCV9_DREPO|nr:hypothetical protein DPMN_016290 [Dreissena polymorpha]